MCKILLVLISSSFLIGCTHVLNNPYEDMPTSQLKKVDSQALCSVANDSRYKISTQLLHELTYRGFKDCSPSEIYCLEKLSLKRGTTNYVQCRLLRDQYELNLKSQQMATFLAIRQLQLQSEAIYTPRTVNVVHSGYINHYIY